LALIITRHRPPGLARVVFHQPQVADGLREWLGLRLRDVVCEIPDELVEHLLRVFGLVEERVHVGAHELAHAPEDRGLCHVGVSRCYVSFDCRAV
jgi:hypothetical protein